MPEDRGAIEWGSRSGCSGLLGRLVEVLQPRWVQRLGGRQQRHRALPQVNASFTNAQGCWDWFGYTGKDCATTADPQISAVKAMVDRLIGTP